MKTIFTNLLNMKGILTLSIIWAGVIFTELHAQDVTIYGPTTANVGDTDMYTTDIINDNLFFWAWDVMGGTQQFETEISVQATWTMSGTNVVIYNAEGYYDWYYGQKTVTVSAGTAPATPPMPTITNNCGSTVLTRATPPTGVTYYWQSTSSGTSTTSSSVSVTRTTGTVYYLRARDNSSLLWSTARTVNYTITQPTIWYQDQDGDGLGDPNSTQSACTQPSGYVSNSDDQCPTQSGTVANNGCPLTGVTSYVTTFETGLGDWTQETYDNFDWTRKSGSTSSSGTGPTAASEGSYYLYTESSSPNYPSKMAVITSTAYALGTNGTFTFDYHMYGATMGQLTLSASTNGGSTWQTIWSMQGDQGNLWHTALVNLTSYQNMAVKFRFTGVTSTSYTSDISIDNIIISSQASGPQEATLSDENYIYTITPTQPTTSDVSALDPEDKIEAITYFDGLGRPKQSIGIRAGGAYEDIITHIGYDAYGRQAKDYLPFSSESEIGTYRDDALNTTNTYYDQIKYNDDFPTMDATNINPFSEKHFEPSPLNRVLEQTAPGESWKYGSTIDANGHSNGHSIKLGYQTNTTGEVRLYGVSLTYANNTYTPTLTGGTSSYYGVGELYKTITKDENWTSGTNHTTEEFKDKQGRVVLKRTYADINSTSTAHDTYYVYDDYGNLTYVLPPKVVHTDGVSTTELNELCYQYKYDNRNRLVEKKIPGKGDANKWESIVYNLLDQPILTQDPNLRNQYKWLYTKYDAFGRVAYTGIVGSSATRAQMQSSVDSISTQWVTRSAATNIGDAVVYYTNAAYPNWSSEVLTINYYDDYIDLPSGLTNTVTTYYGLTSSTNTKGLPTVSKVKVLEKIDNWITTVSYYDNKGRAIYIYSENEFLETIDIVENKLDFTGKVIESKTTHKKTGKQNIVITDSFEYDHMGRLLTQSQTVNAEDPELIVVNSYDELGVLENKKVGGDVDSNNIKDSQGLQTIDYAYNIRGWLKEINDVTSLGSDLFSFKLNYDSKDVASTIVVGSPLFNGNISETIWRTANDNIKRGYEYEYDHLNRLTESYYRENDDLLGGGGKFGTSYNYDKNGNIMGLYRSDINNMDMDELEYHYLTNSNKLTNVVDQSNNLEGFAASSSNYTYDLNGNLISDSGKDITNIVYNHLNLPTSVTINGQNISYIYDAIGVKLQKTVNGTSTDYAGNFIYENGVLQFFNTPEGYVIAKESILKISPKPYDSFNYVYQYKDHLGNVRLSYSDSDGDGSIDASTEIIEELNYYPFGMLHRGYNNIVNGVHHPYQMYNGKEFEESLGFNIYEMDMRQYDPTIARWTSIDPVTHHTMSTYAAFDNNPVFWADPSGADAENNSYSSTEEWMEANGITQDDLIIIYQAPSPSQQKPQQKKKTKAEEARDKYVEMIQSARDDGYNVAADNLQRWLDGTGGTKKISSKWLRGFGAVRTAEEKNIKRFEKQLAKLARGLNDGQTITFSDYWDAALTGSGWTELFYASGTSQITSTGNFTLTRKGDKIYISGSINHEWNDPYDWHAGLSANIPGFGNIKDEDALLVQREYGAKPFHMTSSWSNNVNTSSTIWFGSYISIDLD